MRGTKRKNEENFHAETPGDSAASVNNAEVPLQKEMTTRSLRVSKAVMPKNEPSIPDMIDTHALPNGWLRKSVVRKSGRSAGMIDVYIFSPEGYKFRSKSDIAAYLQRTKSSLNIDVFDFRAKKSSQDISTSVASTKSPKKELAAVKPKSPVIKKKQLASKPNLLVRNISGKKTRAMREGPKKEVKTSPVKKPTKLTLREMSGSTLEVRESKSDSEKVLEFGLDTCEENGILSTQINGDHSKGHTYIKEADISLRGRKRKNKKTFDEDSAATGNKAKVPLKKKVPARSPRVSKAVVAKIVCSDQDIVDTHNLPKGWLRKSVVRKSGRSAGQMDVYFYSPEGLKFRSKPDIVAYLKRTKSSLKDDAFDFMSSIKSPKKKSRPVKPKSTVVKKKQLVPKPKESPKHLVKGFSVKRARATKKDQKKEVKVSLVKKPTKSTLRGKKKNT